MSHATRARARSVLAGLLLTVVALAGCGADDAESPGGQPSSPDVTDEGATAAQVPAEATTGTVTVTADSVIVGDPDAAERVHVYQDLNCPHCRVLHELMADDAAAWAAGTDVAVEYTVVDYLGPRTTHQFSTRGANLLALVADVDPQAWPAVLDALLAMQPATTTEEITTEQLVEAARGAGATLDDEHVLAQEQLAYTAWVETATAQAAAAGVNYIPQVWIDGELVGGDSHEETVELVRQAVAD